MYYYKFRVYFDEVEDFVRDVEILANDNFESFHKILYQCIGLKGNEFAAFSICDRKWNKQKEITITDTTEEEELSDAPEYDEGDSFSTKSRLPKFVMKDAILKDFITDPHQQIIYEYDFINPKIFYIELLKVLQTNTEEGFPRCTHKAMEIPEQLTAADVPDPELDEADEPDEDIMDDDDGYNEEDFSGLNEYSEFS